MHYRIMLSFYGLIFAIAAFATSASAVSLGKIDVASHLGEPFYAELPLSLDEGEVISTVYVELATPADYRILEVYRDQALNAIRADIENDSRGLRIELTSRNVMDAPFFNLVLKVRQGRATHYKKYPVFLDLPRAAQPVKQASPLPTVTVEDAKQAPSVTAVVPVQPMVEETVSPEEVEAPSSFQPHDGWARTSHYGPMVYGDTISTVADRLRVDGRYSRNQVMVALFEKNRSKFGQDNVNLIQAGTHLDVPMAEEVERIRPEQARTIMKEHNQRWKELVKQPRYAAVKEAQETRYSKRVRIGKAASGIASAPVSGQQEQQAGEGDQAVSEMADDSATPIEEEGSLEGSVTGQGDSESAAMLETVTKLQQENEALQTKLAETDAKLAEMSAAGSPEAQVAAEARIKKLELQLARLQSELDSAKQSEVSSSEPDWLLLGGGALVLLLLGGGAGYLMRRERKHPAMIQDDAAFDETAHAEMDEPAPEEIEVEAVEEFSPDATAQMSADDFEDAFSDSIPDLTDEETGEMEAFTEDLEDEPDANVDYLSEADVYLRYGMEDEAEKQVAMALKLRENNPDAHAKLVQIRKARGDESGAEEAIATARTVLAGETLNGFEETIAGIAAGDLVESDDDSLDDTIPPGSLDVSDLQSEESLSDEPAVDELDDIEFDDVEVAASEPEASEPEASEPEASEPEADGETLDMGDLEWPSFDESEESTDVEGEETVYDAGSSDEATIVEDNLSANLSEELPGFDEDDAETAEEATIVEDNLSANLSEELPGFDEDDAETAEESSTADVESSDDTSDSEDAGGLDFDLSGLELPDEGEATSEAASEDADEASSLLQETGEAVEASTDTSDEPAERMDMDDFDLSDLDLSGDSLGDAPESVEEPEEELLTADLDKTVVMDWSKETMASGDHELGGESGAGDIEFDSDDAPEEKATAEAVEEADSEASSDVEADELEEPESNLSSVEFDLEDLDVDLDTPVDSDDLDDFSSTIQTSIEEIKGDSDKANPSVAADVNDDAFGLEPLDDDSDDSISAEGLDSSLDDLKDDSSSLESLIENSDDKDFDATMELDSLLSELSVDEDEDKKKDS